MKKLYYKGNQYIDSSIPVNATHTPTANTISKFDLNAKMNSTDMTDAQIDAFMDDIPYAPMVINDTVPIGAIQAFGGANAPKNWLICNGSAVSRTTYAKLFSVIGTTYGQGDGATTFNLPNLAGKVAVGSGTDYVLGSSGGEETHTLTATEMPSHTHTIGSGRALVNANGAGTACTAAGGSALGFAFMTEIADATGGGGAHNNMQPYVVTNYIIKYDDREVTGGGLKKIENYLYEDGTDNNHWHWRKWSDGKIEAWYYAGSVAFTGGANDSLGTIPSAILPFTTPINLQVSGTGVGFVGDLHHFWIGSGNYCYVTATAAGNYAVSLYLCFKN